MMSTPLYWSRKGEIMCVEHAPETASARWTEEGWQSVPEVAGRRVKYQCQVCGRRAIHHQPTRLPERPHILNVDDRPASLYARDRVLRGHGFTVTNADSGQSALQVARQLQPNLILLDVHLPDRRPRSVPSGQNGLRPVAHPGRADLGNSEWRPRVGSAGSRASRWLHQRS